MNLTDLTAFFKNLVIVVGILYFLTAFMVIFAQKFLISIQQKFINLEERELKQLLWKYVALFKVLFIVFVIGPFIALLMLNP